MKKIYQWEAKTSRIEYLLVGVNNNTKNGKKKATESGLRDQEPQAFVFFLLNEGGGGFFGCQNAPLPRFYILNAGVARPGELTCQIFVFFKDTLTMPSPPIMG